MHNILHFIVYIIRCNDHKFQCFNAIEEVLAGRVECMPTTSIMADDLQYKKPSLLDTDCLI